MCLHFCGICDFYTSELVTLSKYFGESMCCCANKVCYKSICGNLAAIVTGSQYLIKGHRFWCNNGYTTYSDDFHHIFCLQHVLVHV